MKGKKWIALAMVAAMALSGAGLAAFAQGEEGAASPSETVAPIEEVVYVATYFDFDGELLASYAVPAGAVLEEAIFVQIQGGEFLGWYPCDETGAWMGDAPFIFGEPMTGDVFVRACAPGEGLAQPTESASPAGTQSADELSDAFDAQPTQQPMEPQPTDELSNAFDMQPTQRPTEPQPTDELSNAFDMQPTQQPMEPQPTDELNAIFDALLAGSAQSAGQPTEPRPMESAQPTEQPAAPQPEESAQPTEQPAEPQPVEGAQPTEQPTEPQPMESAQPTEQPAAPQPVESAQPTEQPAAPQPVESAQPTEQPAAPQPVESAQPTEQPAEPQPVENAQPTEQPAAPARKVTILVSRDTEELQLGSQITLTAVLEGYEGVPYTCCWQYATADRDGNIVGEWQDAQTDVLSLSYTLTEDNLLTAWRLRVVAADVGLPAIE